MSSQLRRAIQRSIQQTSRSRLSTSAVAYRRSARSHLAVALVPQQEAYIIERFGKYHDTLDAGLAFLIPIVDKIAYVQLLKEQAIPIGDQSAVTKDNVKLHANGVLFIQVIDPYKACYNIENPEVAITELAQTTMRAFIGALSLDRVFRERQILNQQIVEAMNEASIEWGIKCLRYEIKNIDVPKSISEAMEMEVSAERSKRAVVLESEAQKISAINKAEGERQAIEAKAQAEANAVKMMAEANANRILVIGDAMKSEEGQHAVQLQVAEKYIDAYGQLAKKSTTLITGQDVANVPSMVGTAMATWKSMQHNQGSPSADELISDLEGESSRFGDMFAPKQ